MSSDPIEVLRERLRDYAEGLVAPVTLHAEDVAELTALIRDALASLSAPKPESAEAVFNCPTCPVSVQSRWQEPECPECGERCYLDPTAAPAPAHPESAESVGLIDLLNRVATHVRHDNELWQEVMAAIIQLGITAPPRPEASDEELYTHEQMEDYALNKISEMMTATTPQQASAPVGVAVRQALSVVNDAANAARHKGDYASANALVRARVTLYRAALAQQPAAFPARIVLWSRGVAPNWYFIAKKADRADIEGAPVYETLDEIVLRSSQPQVPPGYVLIAEPVLREMVGDERMDQIRIMCKHSAVDR